MGAPSEKPNGKNLGELAGASPKFNSAKGWIRNLSLYEGGTDFMDTLNLAFRPAQVGEQGSASYNKMRVMGMSHQYQSYSHTENPVWSFQVYENSLMILKKAAFNMATGPEHMGQKPPYLLERSSPLKAAKNSITQQGNRVK